jgi:hypothetical protein
MTTAAPSAALATIKPAFTDPERLALAGYLAGYRATQGHRRSPLAASSTADCLPGRFPGSGRVGCASVLMDS